MTAFAQRLKDRYYRQDEHPYRILERKVDSLLNPSLTLLDAGCGRTAPVLARYRSKAGRLIGADLVEFDPCIQGMELHHADLAKLPIANGVVDVAMARSVMEHVTDPLAVYTELHRVLKPGGHFIFLTPNLWDYASLIAKLVPNRLHPWIVARTEGREEQDVFPTAYRTNTRSAILAWATKTGFRVADLRYLSQYPSYFMFNGALFMLAMGYERLTSRLECLDFLRGWILATLQKQ